MSWIESDTNAVYRLMCSYWQQGRWAEANTVAQGQDWFVNWADFPAIAVQTESRLLTSWLVKSAPDTYAYDIWMKLSSNGGVSWSDAFSPHSDGTPTEHGFVSAEPLGEGGYAISWLDGRQTVEPGAPMTLRFAIVNANGSVTDEALLDDRVCDCCQTAMAVAGDGSILVAYRDRTEDEFRDMSIVRRAEGRWSAPILISNDGWKIRGCPVNGPALAAGDSLVAVSWFTMGSEDSARVLCAFSHDFGRSFGAPIRIDSGDPLGRVDILFVEEPMVLVSWLELVGDSARVAVRTVRPEGVVSNAVTVTESSSSRLSGFARMGMAPEGVLIAWTDVVAPPNVKAALIAVR